MWVAVASLMAVTHYRARNAEQAARMWNGGPRGHRKYRTVRYWRKVRRRLVA